MGCRPFEAALKGAREIGFTIISISLSLVAVFIPVLLMGGVIGRIFNEFAVVVTVAILASAFVSLTLTPMLCLAAADRRREADRRRLLGRSRSSAASTRCCAAMTGCCGSACASMSLVLRGLPRDRSAVTAYAAQDHRRRASSRRRISASCRSRRRRAQDISFDAMVGPAGAGRRGLRAVALCRACRQLGGRRRRRPAAINSGPALRRAEAARPSGRRCRQVLSDLRAQLGRRGRHPDLHDAGAEPDGRRAVIGQPVPARRAGARRRRR